MKTIFKFIVYLFAIFGLTVVVVSIIEPYYFNSIIQATKWHKHNKKGLNKIVQNNYGDVDMKNLETLQGEAILNGGDFIKINNEDLYKIEYIKGEHKKSRFDVAGYNPKFSSIFSLPQYVSFEMATFNKNNCYYIGTSLYSSILDEDCVYIPTKRFNLNDTGYPYSIIKFWGEETSQIKISQSGTY